MQERSLGQDFEQWVALSDTYARQISRLRSEGAVSSSTELSQLAHDLIEMDSGFQPPISDNLNDCLESGKKPLAAPNSPSD
ncbi:MAG: hypothetical protein EOP06_11900 [Proteobacteria bacterium]|nr:MAG: hypothetical protein EOP06_11900 [Pseudomonadota bacterium]